MAGVWRTSLLLLLGLVLACKEEQAVPSGRCFKPGMIECASPTRLICVDGTWQPIECAPPCRTVKGRGDCDTPTRLEAGQPCFDPGRDICPPDKHRVLTCKDNRWSPKFICSGLEECKPTPSGTYCAAQRSADVEGAPILPAGMTCTAAAARVISRYASCGLNMNGISPTKLCEDATDQNVARMLEIASSNCADAKRSLGIVD